jgi:hypothetical protein
MANQYYNKKPKQDPIEVRLVLGLLKGIGWLIMLPFRLFSSGSSTRLAGRKAGALNVVELTKKWSDIQTTVGLGGVTHFGSAIVAADKLLDYVLRQKGYAGETMGERLRSAEVDLSPAVYHNTWQAHKLRNQLVHEVESEVVSFQAKEALQYFEAALRELGAIR